MKDRDLMLGGVLLLLGAGLARRGPPRGVVIPLDDELRRVDKPKPKPPTTKPGEPKPSGGGGASGSWTSAPPADAPRAGLEKILVTTAQAVLWKLGADDVAQDGRFSLQVAQTWQEAALAISSSLDTTFERADEERAWVHPKTANTLLDFANKGHMPLNPAGREAPAEKAPEPGEPPPIPNVETPAPKAGLQKVKIATAQLVLLKLGVADDSPFDRSRFQDGIWNEETRVCWLKAVSVIAPNADPTFARASNTHAWVHPTTAGALAKAANEGKRPFKASAAALDAATRAAQAAARGEGEQEDGDVGVQDDVPPVPHLPNPAPVSPPTPVNLERARQSAPKVDKEIKAKRDKYSRKIVSQFQADAGLVPDGLYGPVTQSALRYFGVRDPAKPVFKNRTYTAYQPPA